MAYPVLHVLGEQIASEKRRNPWTSVGGIATPIRDLDERETPQPADTAETGKLHEVKHPDPRPQTAPEHMRPSCRSSNCLRLRQLLIHARPGTTPPAHVGDRMGEGPGNLRHDLRHSSRRNACYVSRCFPPNSSSSRRRVRPASLKASRTSGIPRSTSDGPCLNCMAPLSSRTGSPSRTTG